MKKPQTPRAFSSILDDDNTPPAKPAAKPGKRVQLNIPIDADTKKRLDRAIFWQGRNASQLSYMTAVLQAALDADPNADRLMPGEE